MENEISNNKRHSREKLEELLVMLKLEEAVVVAVGYVRNQPFRDSITCVDFGRESLQPCDGCWLMSFVPREYHQNALPCHQISLNQNGETVAGLASTGDRERLRQTILAWLRGTIAKLEQEREQLEKKNADAGLAA